MSPTLFKYVFWQLAKVFFLASGVIAGIMSFGGLLRPLTEQGLELGQVGKMLAYAMPAMTTYSYPVAALFATTVVFGRLAADNEVTAIRAAGISLGPLGLGLPALVLGLVVSLMSLVFLSYVVPAATLRVERTVVSNIGQFVVNRIEQQHQVRLYQTGAQPLTIFAQAAQLEPESAEHPNQQVVSLQDVSIVTFARSADKKLQVPDEFYIAKNARAYIRQPDNDEGDEKPVLLQAAMADGMKFPRTLVGRDDSAIQGSVKTQLFGPFELRSPLRENTKFMDISRLKDLRANPEKSRRISEILREFIIADQQRDYLLSVMAQLNGAYGSMKFKTIGGDEFKLFPGNVTPLIERNRLILSSRPGGPDTVRLIQTRAAGAASIEYIAREMRMRVFPDTQERQLSVSIELLDAVVKTDVDAARDALERTFFVPMPEKIADISKRTASHYMSRPDLTEEQHRNLARNGTKQENSVVSEMHSRVSFAISCLVLTMVGYGLGVMFKSGNYLTAFAVSVVPALLSIVLIVTGQHICENVPTNTAANFRNPLQLGLITIWSGNAIVLAMAIVLMARLRKT